MKNQYLLKKGKIEVLDIYWEKIIIQIQNQSIRTKDSFGNELCKMLL